MMKRHLAYSLIAIAAVTVAAPAMAKDKNKSTPSPLVTAIDRCRQMTDAMQRLACYDSAANALVSAANSGTAAFGTPLKVNASSEPSGATSTTTISPG